MGRNKFMSLALVGVMIVGTAMLCTQSGGHGKHVAKANCDCSNTGVCTCRSDCTCADCQRHGRVKVGSPRDLDNRTVSAQQIGGNVPQLDYDVHRAYVMIVVGPNHASDPLSKEVIQVFGSDPDIRQRSITKIHVADENFRYRWGDSFVEAQSGAPTIAVMEENGTQARSVYKMPMDAKTDLKKERDRVRVVLKELAVNKNAPIAYNDAKSNFYDEDALSEGIFNRGGSRCSPANCSPRNTTEGCLECLKRRKQQPPAQPPPAAQTNAPPTLPPIANTPQYTEEEEQASGEMNPVAVVLALGVAALVIQAVIFGIRKPG